MSDWGLIILFPDLWTCTFENPRFLCHVPYRRHSATVQSKRVANKSLLVPSPSKNPRLRHLSPC
ncbi:hypothetical protein L484_025439 [Morus notabilis]|uniref:Uncharacterized protein n=1 Tax=Morus notabilis TaxID=981085 RepID=W9RQX0_9ROSA|nr:hypothetical protein L484_025439 [Morus notabilis]